MYTRTMILTVPVELIDVANKLAQAFDPDQNGMATFQLPSNLEGDLPTTVAASTPISATVGANTLGGASLKGNLYGMVSVKGATTDAERTNMRKQIAKAAGITL